MKGGSNLFTITTQCPNLVFVGERLWQGFAGSDHFALEAWERMTTGGVHILAQFRRDRCVATNVGGDLTWFVRS